MTLPSTARRIPRRFFDDHRERDLPTPHIWKATTKHVWISFYDPNFAELVSDAEYYAHPDGPDGAPEVVRAAKAMLEAIWRD